MTRHLINSIPQIIALQCDLSDNYQVASEPWSFSWEHIRRWIKMLSGFLWPLWKSVKQQEPDSTGKCLFPNRHLSIYDQCNSRPLWLKMICSLRPMKIFCAGLRQVPDRCAGPRFSNDISQFPTLWNRRGNKALWYVKKIPCLIFESMKQKSTPI